MSKEKTVQQLRAWFKKYERPISSLSLIGGFVFNALTLKRVDLFWENFWVVAHLVLVGACIIFINRQENDEATEQDISADPARLHFWLVNILQFFFGGLLSTFIVFYFRSAVLSVTWPFFAVLLIAFFANESFKRHYSRMAFQIGFFFLSIFLFAIFLVPVLLHETSATIFLMSGGLSLIVLLLFMVPLKYFAKEKFRKSRDVLLGTIVGIYVVVNALYFLNLIPPLPLALSDAGIYHKVVREADGTYIATREHEGSLIETIESWVSMYPSFHTNTGGPVYAYSAVFSPVSFNTKIIHEWQQYDSVAQAWITKASVPLSVTGGRENGFRTYSINSGMGAGKWRVNVLTPSGQVIGRMAFTVETTDIPTQFTFETKK